MSLKICDCYFNIEMKCVGVCITIIKRNETIEPLLNSMSKQVCCISVKGIY